MRSPYAAMAIVEFTCLNCVQLYLLCTREVKKMDDPLCTNPVSLDKLIGSRTM